MQRFRLMAIYVMVVIVVVAFAVAGAAVFRVSQGMH